MKKITLYLLVLLLNLASFSVLVGYVGNYNLPLFLDETYAVYGTLIIYILSFVLFFTVNVKTPDERFLLDFEVFGSEEHPLEVRKLVSDKVEVLKQLNADTADNSNTIDEQTVKAMETLNTHPNSPETDLKASVKEIVSNEVKDHPVRMQEALIGPILENDVPHKSVIEVIDFSTYNNLATDSKSEEAIEPNKTDELTNKTVETNLKDSEESTSNTPSDK